MKVCSTSFQCEYNCFLLRARGSRDPKCITQTLYPYIASGALTRKMKSATWNTRGLPTTE